MRRCAVIMAGGAGERFWPLSRANYPKQLLKITGNRSMLSQAIERIAPLVGVENVFIITGKSLKGAIEREATELPPGNVIAEPEGKNTAACLALAVAYVEHVYGEPSTMVVLTADHSIRDEDVFRKDCVAALEHAENSDALVTFGIVPTRAETGYGYIEVGKSQNEVTGIFNVESFREKPNAELARDFVESGRFLWNSGIFVWRTAVLRNAILEHLPQAGRRIDAMVQALKERNSAEALSTAFSPMPKTSIDVGVLERADNVSVVRARFDWDDIGTWNSLARIFVPDEQGNICFGKCAAVRSGNSIMYSVDNESDGKKLAVGFGLENMIVVNTPDAILVLPAERAQEVKEVVNFLREHGENEFL